MIKESYCLSEISSLTGYHNSTLSKRFTKEGTSKSKVGSRVYFKFKDLPADLKELIDKAAPGAQGNSAETKSRSEDNFDAAGAAAYSEEVDGIGFFTRPTVELTAELIDRFINLFGDAGASNILVTDYCLHPYGTEPADPAESDGD